jgi:hypothetical protein
LLWILYKGQWHVDKMKQTLLEKIARYRRQREYLLKNLLPNWEGTDSLRTVINREKWFHLTHLDHNLSIAQDSLIAMGKGL